MNISDEERRKVARKLREDAANDKLREQVFVEEIIAGCIGETMHDEWGNVREVEILTKLADLVDRPTCAAEQDYDAMEDGIPDCRIWVCHGCGERFPYWRGEKPGYCPNCGAEVAR